MSIRSPSWVGGKERSCLSGLVTFVLLAWRGDRSRRRVEIAPCPEERRGTIPLSVAPALHLGPRSAPSRSRAEGEAASRSQMLQLAGVLRQRDGRSYQSRHLENGDRHGAPRSL